MAACPILDFGAMPASRDRADRPPEIDPQQPENPDVDYYLVRQIAEQRERSEVASLGEAVQQSGRTSLLPLAASLVGSQIESLPKSEDIEVRPTNYAHGEAMRLIVGAYVSIFSHRQRHRLPRPIIGTDDAGAILISWTSGNKYVAAKFAPQPGSRSFVYFEEGAQHQALDLSEQNLLNRLQWL